MKKTKGSGESEGSEGSKGSDREFPEVFDQRAEQSRRLGARLVRVKNERIFLDELDPKAKGRPLKTMPDCGLFCEEDE